MSKKNPEIENLEQNEIATWAERKLSGLAPYASQIALMAALAFAAFVALTYFFAWRQDAAANQWRELNISATDARFSGNASSLVEIYDQYPDQKVGMWSLQMAGDFDMSTGLNQMVSDREEGKKLLERARSNYLRILEAPAAAKTDELLQRSLYSLAYTCEGLGQFEDAKKYFDRLLEEYPQSFLKDNALRGAERCSNDSLIAMYDKFNTYEGSAPGALVPQSPSLDLGIPDFNLDDIEQPNSGGGDFGSGDGDSPDVPEPPPAETDAAETDAPNATGDATPADTAPSDSDAGSDSGEGTSDDGANGEGETPNSNDGG